MSAPRTLYDRVGAHEGLMRLLRTFYADVRQHAVLGPIFNQRIHDWPVHLAKIAEFWALQTGGESSYAGGFARAHLFLGLRAEHFGHWLGLWEFNCRRFLAPSEADELIGLAHEFGRRLSAMVEGRSGLEIRRSSAPTS